MINRTRARRRRTWRLALFTSLLLALISFEALTMSVVYRQAMRLPTHPEMTIDPTICFQLR